MAVSSLSGSSSFPREFPQTNSLTFSQMPVNSAQHRSPAQIREVMHQANAASGGFTERGFNEVMNQPARPGVCFGAGAKAFCADHGEFERDEVRLSRTTGRSKNPSGDVSLSQSLCPAAG